MKRLLYNSHDYYIYIYIYKKRYSKEQVKAMDIEQAGKATEGPNQSQQKLAKLIYKNSAPNGSKIVYISL
jgi:hypothetical protein